MGIFGADIELCKSGGDIELCLERDIELCTSCAELTLSGTDEPEVGSVYTATGGSGTLTFTFDKGSINSAGVITSIDSCPTSGASRTGTVTVTDECTPTNQTAEVQVRLSGGQWNYLYSEGMATGAKTPALTTSEIASAELDQQLADCCCGSGSGNDSQRVGYDGASPWDAYYYPMFTDGIGGYWQEYLFEEQYSRSPNCQSGSDSCGFCSLSSSDDKDTAAQECLHAMYPVISTLDMVVVPSSFTAATALAYPSGTLSGGGAYLTLIKHYYEWVCP